MRNSLMFMLHKISTSPWQATACLHIRGFIQLCSAPSHAHNTCMTACHLRTFKNGSPQVDSLRARNLYCWCVAVQCRRAAEAHLKARGAGLQTRFEFRRFASHFTADVHVLPKSPSVFHQDSCHGISDPVLFGADLLHPSSLLDPSHPKMLFPARPPLLALESIHASAWPSEAAVIGLVVPLSSWCGH
jgi:hypothetical protein